VVRVEVVVRDEVGKDVADLRMKDFKIYEGEANQVICFWERQETSAKGQTSTHYKFGYYPMNKNIDDNRRRIKVQVTAEGKAVDLQLDGPVS